MGSNGQKRDRDADKRSAKGRKKKRVPAAEPVVDPATEPATKSVAKATPARRARPSLVRRLHTRVTGPPMLVNRTALRRRGWTESGIERFLGGADAHSPNPMYRTSAHMRLYDLERVTAAESTDEWRQWRTESEKRRAAIRARAEARGNGGVYAEVASEVAARSVARSASRATS
jgi:hypothetical protein